MSSPTDTTSVLSGPLSTSPTTIKAPSEHSHSPVRRRTSTNSEIDPAARPHLSPTLSRSYNIHDPEVRERQRTMDADMAMQLSRARSSTIIATSPVATSPPQSRPSMEHDEPAFPIPILTRQEEHDLEFARGVRQDTDTGEPTEAFQTGPEPETHLNHLSAGHDPSLLVSLAGPEPDEIGGLPMYQASVPFQEQAEFDFSALEAFAREEKRSLGIVSPTTSSPPEGGIPSSQTTTSTVPPLPEFNLNGGTDFSVPFTMPRTRQRKLSQSVGPRRGKMALFENPTGGPPPSLAFRTPQLANVPC